MDAPPKHIRGFKEERYLQITWEEGHVGIYPYRHLRGECACANCVDEMTGIRRLDPTSVPENIVVTDMKLVGNYALKFVWSDGHSTGIYTWKRLRGLCPCPLCKRQ